MKKLCIVIYLLIAPSYLSQAQEAGTEETAIDPTSGMKIDENWQLVMSNCIACHSAKQFTNYGASRDTWASLIKWMQKTQGLWPFTPETEDKILTYLAKNYPPGKASRRPNLAINLRPENPYKSVARKEYEALKAKGLIKAPQ